MYLVATVKVQEVNGASPTYTDKSVGSPARFCTADSASPGTGNPCVIPPSGQTYYSYWKHFCLDIATGTGFTKINNVRFYSDGTISWTLGTGGRVVAGQRDDPGGDGGHGVPIGTDYQQSAGTEGTTGYAIKVAVNGHAYYKDETAAVVAITTFTSGAPCTVDSADHVAAEKTKAIVLQTEQKDDATQGEQADETFTFIYDEI